jgi:Flp pilus assembly protein TadD/outer membrane receptor protein involved in Fe transport
MRLGLYCLIALLATSTVFGEVPFSATIVSVRGDVDYSVDGKTWHDAAKGQQVGANTRLRTGDDSRAAIKLSTGAILRIDELSLVDLVPPSQPDNSVALSIIEGLFYFFSRSTPEAVEILTPSATGAIRGTEFNLSVSRQGATTYAMVEGGVDITSEGHSVSLAGGEVAMLGPSREIQTSSLSDNYRELHQWLYYPPVLVPSELQLNDQDRRRLQESLQHYQQGNLKAAVATGLAQQTLTGNDAHLYRANLKLMAGQLDDAKALMDAADKSPLLQSLRKMFDAVTFASHDQAAPTNNASEWLAYSYWKQSRGDIPGALAAARQALQRTDNFGPIWARLAELQFSSGELQDARKSLSRSLEFSPKNPMSISLQGFLSAAETAQSLPYFQQALALDADFAQSWLGDGLQAFRQGQAKEGLESIKLAAAMEPNRSLLRSYLGKALAENELQDKARQELVLAQALDTQDPTPLFYRALLDKQQNRYSDAARSMHRAIELNDNRNLFRSRLLLDQDLSVRKTNLAAIYESLGMSTRAVRYASQAIEDDYSNYSAHRYMADSLTRQTGTDLLRTEAAIASELLLANLLAPAQTGTLSRFVSNQEYSAFFNNKRYGLDVNAYLDEDHESLSEISAYLNGHRTSVVLDASIGGSLNFFEADSVETDFDTGLLSLQIKHHLTEQTSVYLQLEDSSTDVDAGFFGGEIDGDIDADIDVYTLGFHHRHRPGSDTLLLISRYDAETRFETPSVPMIFTQGAEGETTSGLNLPFQSSGMAEEKLTSLELNHIQQNAERLWISGLRLQRGDITLDEQLDHLTGATRPFFADPVSVTRLSEDLERTSAYTYLTLGLESQLDLTLGLAYEWLEAPRHIESPPATGGSFREQRWSPKLGLNWSPAPQWRLRAAYSGSLGGFAADQSLRLEPSLLAGFVQTYRSLIPIAPDVSGSRFDVAGIGLQYSPSADLFLDAQYQWIQQRGNERLGAFDYDLLTRQTTPQALTNRLEYREQNISLSANQLLSQYWSVGARYEFVQSDLETGLLGVDAVVTDPLITGLTSTDTRARLQSFGVMAAYNHPLGIFARLDSTFYWPQDSGFYGVEQQDDFSSSDFRLGYRSQRQRWQVELRVDNLEDEEPRINSLIPRAEIQSRRTARITLNLNL